AGIWQPIRMPSTRFTARFCSHLDGPNHSPHDPAACRAPIHTADRRSFPHQAGPTGQSSLLRSIRTMLVNYRRILVRRLVRQSRKSRPGAFDLKPATCDSNEGACMTVHTDYLQADLDHLLHPLYHPSAHQQAKIWVEGHGAIITDVDGGEYIDG